MSTKLNKAAPFTLSCTALIPDTMNRRYFGFVLLLLFPPQLHAQTAAQPCRAPRLVEGYFVPELEVYSHGSKITYGCNDRHKPAVEGWWATSTCQNGVWLQTPQCIDENACIPPVIPNAEYTESSDSWYGNEAKIRTTCDKGYEHRNHAATATCINGTWSALPVCEIDSDACGVPPKVPHAVIINQEYQELFVVDSSVQYECENGFTIDGAQSRNKSVICLSGIWSEGPVCRRQTAAETGHRGSGTGDGHTTAAGSGRKPTAGAGTSGSDVHIAPIRSCGNLPVVQNGVVVSSGEMFVRYQCAQFYTLVGQDTVVCYSDGTRTEVPICRPSYCSVDTHSYPMLQSKGVKYIKDGERVTLDCVDDWVTRHYSVVHCTNGQVDLSRCCNWFQINTKLC